MSNSFTSWTNTVSKFIVWLIFALFADGYPVDAGRNRWRPQTFPPSRGVPVIHAGAHHGYISKQGLRFEKRLSPHRRPLDAAYNCSDMVVALSNQLVSTRLPFSRRQMHPRDRDTSQLSCSSSWLIDWLMVGRSSIHPITFQTPSGSAHVDFATWGSPPRQSL